MKAARLFRGLLGSALLTAPCFGVEADPAAAAVHWAFQPVRASVPPAVRETGWERTPVDRFIQEKLEAAGLEPAPAADARTLLRRMAFDLAGLPPSAAEVEEFAADLDREGEAGLERWIDRLLASPRYGERWGRHWLDVARYSDSKGYVYAREERFFVHAPHYRDWVIGALNRDLPYDDFLRLQIAADQIVPPDSPDLAAMGFLTVGRRFIGVTHDIIDDRIDVVTRGAMALTVQCARCHDHKYDPVTAHDYYALYGVFHQDRDRLVRLGAAPERRLEGADPAYGERVRQLEEAMRKRREEAAERLRARIADYLAAQFELEDYPEEGFDQILTETDLIPASVRRWRDFLLLRAGAFDPVFAPWHALAGLGEEEFARESGPRLEALRGAGEGALHPLVAKTFAHPPASRRELAKRYGALFAGIDAAWKTAVREAEERGGAPPAGLDGSAEALRRFLYDPDSPLTVPDTGIVHNELYFTTAVCEELWRLQGELDRWILGTPTAPPHAVIVTAGQPEPDPRVFLRGTPSRLGEPVPRRFPAFLSGVREAPFRGGNERLDLAEAIVDERNPLTARVMVNRVWQHHFGEGLVRTASDFGLRADPPSHPELLDYLAARLVAEGWSLKSLHRLILRSAVYRQASRADDPAAERLDPDGRLLSRFPRRRLSLEELRDAFLAAGGELDQARGGIGGELLDPGNRRRSVYARVDRQYLPGVFRVFDFANPDLHVAERSQTTVPQQVLFLLNNGFVADRARSLAARAADAGPDRESRIARLYRLVYQRDPAPAEREAGLRFVAAAEAEWRSAERPAPSPWRYGWGSVDEAGERVMGFTELPHFTGESWQGGEQWPGGALGWLQLTAEGGHPGDDLQHAVIRRWVAPVEGHVDLAGELIHDAAPGDGIRAFLISSRHGQLASAVLHNGRQELAAQGVSVRPGDTLDFVVDIGGELNSDQFLWAPVIRGAERDWDARRDFSGPDGPAAAALEPWEQYAQVLLMANEFTFVD